MIRITDNAAKALANLLQEKNAAKGQGLRIGVEKGGCAGMQYVMKVDDVAEGDEISENAGAKVFVDEESRKYLQDCVLDFSDSLNDAGFKLENPNAVRSCGCGTSFEMQGEHHEPEECK